MVGAFEWIVLVELTDEKGASSIEMADVERLVDALDDVNISALYHPERYAIQLNVDAPTATKAVASAVKRCSEAARCAGLPLWDLARVELLSTEEFARELDADERTFDTTAVAATIVGTAAAFAEDLLARAFRDSLTGLSTTALFRDRVAAALAADDQAVDEHHCLIVIDLDGFADLNRSRGYAAGDQVLAVVAERLGQAAGPGAEVARIGGDEFAILLAPRDADTMERLAVRVLDAVAAPVKLAQGDVSVSASLGIAEASGRDVDGLMHDATVAMCAAKDAGGRRHQWFLPGLAADLSRLEFDIDPAPDRLSSALLLERAAMAANEETNLASAAHIVLQQVCAHAGWVAGRFTDIEADDISTPAGSIWHATSIERSRRLQHALDHREPGDTGNLRTQVEVEGQAAWLTDVAARSSAWAREAAQVGIRATYGFPVCAGHEVVGVLEFFSTRAVKPDGSLLDVMKSVGSQLGRVVERRRARVALARSSENYRALAECVPVMMWRTDTEGKVNYLNRRWLEFTGRTLDEELGDGWTEGVHPEDLSRCLDAHRNALVQRGPFEMTYRLRRADGQYRWVLDRGSPVGTGDDYRGFVGGALDVTERQSAEQELRRSHAHFRALLDHAGAVTILLSADGTVIEEHTGSISLGYENDHSRGRVGFEYIHPDDRGRAAEAFVEVLGRPGVHPPVECRVEAADGSWRVMETVANNQLHNPDIDGIIVTSVEVTERKKAELALIESAHQLQEALALAQVGTWRRDLVVGEDSCSAELCGMLGCAPARCVLSGSLEMSEAVHAEDRVLFKTAVEELIAPGDVREGVFRIVRPNGELRWLHGRMTAVGADGETTAVLATFQDVTERAPAVLEPALAPERWRAPHSDSQPAQAGRR